MRVSIFWKIVLGFSLLLLLMIGLGIYNLLALNTTIANSSALLARNQRLINDIRTIQVDFKRQVQEWKNILIRGHDRENFKKYLVAFREKYIQVQDRAKALRDLGESPEMVELLDTFLFEHEKLQQGYLHSLAMLQAGEEYNYRAADQHVRGLDRPPTEMLDTLVELGIKETGYTTQKIDMQGNVVKIISSALLGCLIMVFVGIALTLARKLSKPLSEIRDVLQHVSAGNLKIQCHIDSYDEIGDLARSANDMITYLQRIAAVTEKVTHNEFDVDIIPQSDDDVLNHSLAQMVETLRTTIQELGEMVKKAERQSWIKDGLNDLNSVLSGISSATSISERALNFIARYVSAGHGVLYVYDVSHAVLRLSGTFAFTENDRLAEEFRLGEGVVGQVARERAPIMLTNIVRRDSEITTGILSEAPLHTYTYPLLYNDGLYGVLELATNEPLTEKHQDFLTSANRIVATALFAVIM